MFLCEEKRTSRGGRTCCVQGFERTKMRTAGMSHAVTGTLQHILIFEIELQ